MLEAALLRSFKSYRVYFFLFLISDNPLRTKSLVLLLQDFCN